MNFSNKFASKSLPLLFQTSVQLMQRLNTAQNLGSSIYDKSNTTFDHIENPFYSDYFTNIVLSRKNEYWQENEAWMWKQLNSKWFCLQIYMKMLLIFFSKNTVSDL